MDGKCGTLFEQIKWEAHVLARQNGGGGGGGGGGVLSKSKWGHTFFEQVKVKVQLTWPRWPPCPYIVNTCLSRHTSLMILKPGLYKKCSIED